MQISNRIGTHMCCVWGEELYYYSMQWRNVLVYDIQNTQPSNSKTTTKKKNKTSQRKKSSNIEFIELYAVCIVQENGNTASATEFHYIEFYKWIFNQNCLFTLVVLFSIVFLCCSPFFAVCFVLLAFCVFLFVFTAFLFPWVDCCCCSYCFFFSSAHSFCSFYLVRIPILLRVFAAYCDTIFGENVVETPIESFLCSVFFCSFFSSKEVTKREREKQKKRVNESSYVFHSLILRVSIWGNFFDGFI